MSKRPRRNHSPLFKVKVAVDAPWKQSLNVTVTARLCFTHTLNLHSDKRSVTSAACYVNACSRQPDRLAWAGIC